MARGDRGGRAAGPTACGLDGATCADALRILVGAGFLRQTDAGYLRVTDESAPRLRVAKAELGESRALMRRSG